MMDFVEIENKIIEKNMELEDLVLKYREELLKYVELKCQYKLEYAKAYLKNKISDNPFSKVTEEQAAQKTLIDTYSLYLQVEVSKAIVDAIYEKIQQVRLEIDSLRSILSAYKETYERTPR
ncbi:MAG: hypothetical protein RMI30_03255 [Thermodesulfovibrio sp.]|nr:hypothetical protein [Thermodesulfovibrio sp.]